jgi:hypothetical protein
MWRAKIAFLKHKIILMHESAGERKSHEENTWKWQLRAMAIGKKWQKD